jgi:hypothetical protein
VRNGGEWELVIYDRARVIGEGGFCTALKTCISMASVGVGHGRKTERKIYFTPQLAFLLLGVCMNSKYFISNTEPSLLYSACVILLSQVGT